MFELARWIPFDPRSACQVRRASFAIKNKLKEGGGGAAGACTQNAHTSKLNFSYDV